MKPQVLLDKLRACDDGFAKVAGLGNKSSSHTRKLLSRLGAHSSPPPPPSHPTRCHTVAVVLWGVVCVAGGVAIWGGDSCRALNHQNRFWDMLLIIVLMHVFKHDRGVS